MSKKALHSWHALLYGPGVAAGIIPENIHTATPLPLQLPFFVVDKKIQLKKNLKSCYHFLLPYRRESSGSVTTCAWYRDVLEGAGMCAIEDGVVRVAWRGHRERPLEAMGLG